MVASLHFTSADENDFIADGNGFNYKRFVFSSAVAAASDQLVLAENVEGGNEDGDVRDERRRVCDIVAGNGEQEQVTLTMTSQIVVIICTFILLSSGNVRRYLLDDPRLFSVRCYFVLRGIGTCLGVSNVPLQFEFLFTEFAACSNPPRGDSHRKTFYPRTQQRD